MRPRLLSTRDGASQPVRLGSDIILVTGQDVSAALVAIRGALSSFSYALRSPWTGRHWSRGSWVNPHRTAFPSDSVIFAAADGCAKIWHANCSMASKLTLSNFSPIRKQGKRPGQERHPRKGQSHGPDECLGACGQSVPHDPNPRQASARIRSETHAIDECQRPRPTPMVSPSRSAALSNGGF
jgi:hypothetical protein